VIVEIAGWTRNVGGKLDDLCDDTCTRYDNHEAGKFSSKRVVLGRDYTSSKGNRASIIWKVDSLGVVPYTSTDVH
jgi:hypothetical protein